MSNPIFTIAGNYREFFNFLDSQGLPRDTEKYIFISDPMRLYGMRDIEVLCVGQYSISPVFSFKESIGERGIKFVTLEGNEAT